MATWPSFPLLDVSPKAETSTYKSLEVTSHDVPPSTHRTQNAFLPKPKYSRSLSPGRAEGRAKPHLRWPHPHTRWQGGDITGLAGPLPAAHANVSGRPRVPLWGAPRFSPAEEVQFLMMGEPDRRSPLSQHKSVSDSWHPELRREAASSPPMMGHPGAQVRGVTWRRLSRRPGTGTRSSQVK